MRKNKTKKTKKVNKTNKTMKCVYTDEAKRFKRLTLKIRRENKRNKIKH